jgi:hypothetical protein
VAERIVQLPRDPEALLARPPKRLLLPDLGGLDGALSSDANDLGPAQEDEEPGAEARQCRHGRSPTGPDQVVQPGEDDEPGQRGDRGGEPVPANDGRDVGQDEGKPDWAVRVAEQEVDERRPEHDLHDDHRVPAPCCQ